MAEQASETERLVQEALEVGLGGSAPLVIHAKMIRQELLAVKAELERELERLELDCSACGRRVHWLSGSASAPATGPTVSPHRAVSRSSRRNGANFGPRSRQGVALRVYMPLAEGGEGQFPRR